MKTSDVKAALTAFYKPSEYALMWEVSNGTGSNARRHADAVVMNLWPSRGLDISGIEIKVSRSDWRRELDNPAKSEPVQKFCDHWWVVAPKGIVQLQELPALWGLREVDDRNRITTVKAAPPLNSIIPREPSPIRGFMAALLRRSSEMDFSMVESLVQKKLTSMREEDNRRIEAEVNRRTQKAIKLEKLEEVMKTIGLYHYDEYSVRDFIETYKVGKKIKSTSLLSLKHSAERLREASDLIHELASLAVVEDPSS